MSKLPDFVTRSVPRSVPASRVKELEAEVASLTAEVAHLKRQLAEARGGAPKPMTATERSRKLREKLKTAKRRPFGEQQFEG
jgi:hypothetical protein